jgi:hypothetical protein
MAVNDWNEALIALEGEVTSPERRRALVNIVRDEIDRLDRASAVRPGRIGAPRRRERAVHLTWRRDEARFAMKCDAWDLDWLSDLFLDAMHADLELRFRPLEGGGYGVAKLDPDDLVAGDVVFKGVRGVRLWSIDFAASFRCRTVEEVDEGGALVALIGSIVSPGPAHVVDVSTTEPVIEATRVVAAPYVTAAAGSLCPICNQPVEGHAAVGSGVGGVPVRLLCDEQFVKVAT